MTKITAHRGYSKKYPENTLIAFQHVVATGAERIELDVHFTKDKQLVVHHAYSLGNPDNGEGLIFEKDWAYIKTLDAGSWFSKDFSEEKVPLLEEIFQNLGDKVEYEIELKGFGEVFIQTVLHLVEKYKLLKSVEFTSASLFMLITVKKLQPKAKIGMFIPQIPSWMSLRLAQTLYISELQLGEINVAHCRQEILTETYVQVLHDMGIKVHAADCNTEESLRNAFVLGVDQLSTNDLELALDIRNSLQ